MYYASGPFSLVKIQSTRNYLDELIFGNGRSRMVCKGDRSSDLVELLMTIVVVFGGLDYVHRCDDFSRHVVHRDVKSAKWFRQCIRWIWKGLQLQIVTGK